MPNDHHAQRGSLSSLERGGSEQDSRQIWVLMNNLWFPSCPVRYVAGKKRGGIVEEAPRNHSLRPLKRPTKDSVRAVYRLGAFAVC